MELKKIAANETMKCPVAVTKKRSGPLENRIDSINEDFSSSNPNKTLDILKTRKPIILNKRRLSSAKDKEKKRERWLLTRKTWRYMSDVGRKIIPDVAHMRPNTNAFIEEHFQKVCSLEPTFVPWRRKSSYPGSVTTSKRCSRLLSSVNCSAKGFAEKKEIDNADRLIVLLQIYLDLRDNYKTTTLLGTKTVRPDQTFSPSARRPIRNIYTSNNNISTTGQFPEKPIETELLYRLKLLSSSTMFENEIDLSDVSNYILEDKTILKKLYCTLKKEQLHRSLHSKDPHSNIRRVSSLNSLPNISNHENTYNRDVINCRFKNYQNKHDDQYNLEHLSTAIDKRFEKPLSSCGTQTTFIQLNELRHLAEQCKANKRNYSLKDCETRNVTRLNNRKSSIDNEDISQSVSDTIKRYLKMARKKSVHDSEENRFKSINYDTSLKQIKAKEGIHLPGLSQGLNKAVQTLDAWPLIELDFIKGHDISNNLAEAHIEWKRAEDERIHEMFYMGEANSDQKKDTNNSKINKLHISRCTSAPTSPTSQSKLDKKCKASTGLLISSSQFLSNILHGHGHIGNNYNTFEGNQNIISHSSKNATPNMQKSKSLSNVGQFVTQKILRGRSKRPNLGNDFTPQKWYPSEYGLWISEYGDTFKIEETLLTCLTNAESDFLKYISLEKIKEINIGNAADLPKLIKKRIVPKKKCLTTSFFDIGRKEEDEPLFGISLERCLAKDSKRYQSKHSLLTVFRGNGRHTGSVGNLNDTVRSCESLPVTCGSIEPFANISKASPSILQLELMNSELDFDKQIHETAQLQIPIFVNTCIEYLTEYGLEIVGLFRVSTSKKRVKQLREEFNKNSHFRIPCDTCPHDVATLFKEFLRDLPEPLLCSSLYPTFLETQRIRNRRLQLEAISHLIRILPISHRDTLYVLLAFLAKVSTHSDDIQDSDGNFVSGNKMDSNNLATVFAPNILRGMVFPSERTKEQEHISDSINVVRSMIDHYEELFKISVELIDVIYTQMRDVCPEKLDQLISRKLKKYEW
ncbi:hypothetical protein KR018_011283 [Drosophila ironensis]|nr:hypothetical protein KR018_011283 [Drosophila ironensis]